VDFDYDRCWPYLLRIAYSLGVPPQWREDCAQEMAVALWQAPPTAYWPIVARRQGVDFLRSDLHTTGYRVRRAFAGRRIQPALPPDLSLEVVADTGGFLRKATPNFDAAAVERVDLENDWRHLPPRCALVLALYAAGYRWWEIGKRLGVTETRACQIGQIARRLLANRRAGTAHAIGA
jgi:DNA-directed RNA polymerase specialized sigma24 family protein